MHEKTGVMNLEKVIPAMCAEYLVYVAQPFGGDTDAYKVARRIIRDLIRTYPQASFVSPVLQYGYMYEDVEYIEGLEICINLLSRCGGLLLLPGWRESRGCLAEWATARERKIPIFYGDGFGNMWYEIGAPMRELGDADA